MHGKLVGAGTCVDKKTACEAQLSHGGADKIIISIVSNSLLFFKHAYAIGPKAFGTGMAKRASFASAWVFLPPLAMSMAFASREFFPPIYSSKKECFRPDSGLVHACEMSEKVHVGCFKLPYMDPLVHPCLSSDDTAE